MKQRVWTVPLMLCTSFGGLCGCGGSSSETPFPAPPVPSGLRHDARGVVALSASPQAVTSSSAAPQAKSPAVPPAAPVQTWAAAASSSQRAFPKEARPVKK